MRKYTVAIYFRRIYTLLGGADFQVLDPIYTWITTKPSTLGQQIFGNVTITLSLNYSRRQVFRLCLFCEISYYHLFDFTHE